MNESTFNSKVSFKINDSMKKTTSFLMKFSCVMIFILMIFISVDVFMRTMFNSPISGSIEICELLMVLLCFASFPYTQNQDEQLGIDLFTAKMKPSTRSIASLFTNVIASFYTITLALEMLTATIKFYTREDITVISHIPVWPFMGFATLMMAFLGFIILVNTWMDLERCKHYKKIGIAIFMIALGLIISYLPFWFAGTSLGLTKVALGGLCFVYLIFLSMLGMPIGYAMLVTGVQVLILIMPNVKIALTMIGASPFYSTGTILMVVIPMFVLMGEFALYGNISSALFRTCKVWTGSMPGGLAISSIGGCAGFAAVCGDTWVTALTMSSVAMPAMDEAKYHRPFSAACLCIGGPLGILIPPSLGFIVYAIVTDQSVGKLFMAGLIPGILLAILLCLIIYVRVKLNPSLAPRGQSYTWKEKFASLSGVLPVMALFTIIIGGILTGIFTPNEGGAVAALSCFIYTLILGSMDRERLKSALLKTVDITSKSFIVFVGVGIMGYALAASRFPLSISEFILSMELSKYGVLFAVVCMFTILGCLMSATPMLLLALPAVFPTVMALGFDPIWFGVVCVIMMELCAVTPPVGLVVYALASVVEGVPVASIFYQLLPLYLGIFFLLILLVIFPEIALFLPNLLF